MKCSATMATAALGQQEVDVRDAAVLRVLDRDDRARGAAVLDRIERILEAEAGQRQAVGRIFERGPVRIGARRALEGDRARRIGGGGLGHLLDQREGGLGKAVHRAAALRAAEPFPQWPAAGQRRRPGGTPGGADMGLATARGRH